MKKKIGTIIEEDVLIEAKERAARDGRGLAEVIQDALISYLHTDTSRRDAERACRHFCAHGTGLSRAEIDDLLQEDMLAS